MTRNDLNRRDFNQLTMAALGGVVAGTIAGCGGGGQQASTGTPGDTGESASESPAGEATQVAVNDWMGDVHVCRGLNACEGKGAGGQNACAGQGACATAAAHDCHAMNDCKFQGGCGESVGTNDCQGKGECAVPLSDAAWTTARAKYEAAMNTAGKAIGDAPAKQG